MKAGPDERERVNGSMTQVAGWCTYTFLLWTIKAAMCAFYLRLTVRGTVSGCPTRLRLLTAYSRVLGGRRIQETDSCWVRSNRRKLDCRPSVYPSGLPAAVEELADISRPWQYVLSTHTPAVANQT